MLEFTDKVALVSGAASGIGLAIATALAAKGAKVVLGDVNDDAVAKVVTAITDAGGIAIGCHYDVSDPASAEAAVKTAVDTYGALHLAVNNAGIAGPAALTADYPVDSWDKVIAINLSGVFYGLKYEIPAILAAGGGSIVNMASILGSVGTPYSPAYVAAKHGVVGLTKSAALSVASKGIRVNSVGPGYIETPLIKDVGRDMLIELHPQGRLGTADEVANIVLFLLSEDASFVNGAYHTVDGAYTAQ